MLAVQEETPLVSANFYTEDDSDNESDFDIKYEQQEDNFQDV